MDEDSLDPTQLLAAQSHLLPGQGTSNEPDLAAAQQGQHRFPQGGNSTLVPGFSCFSLLPVQLLHLPRSWGKSGDKSGLGKAREKNSIKSYL